VKAAFEANGRSQRAPRDVAPMNRDPTSGNRCGNRSNAPTCTDVIMRTVTVHDRPSNPVLQTDTSK
jgi:hypothetical protein